jgi:cation transport regulator ChaC
VTLIESEDESVCGRCFWVKAEAAEEVLGLLDEREQGGYERTFLRVDTAIGVERNEEVDAVTYVALSHNRNYLGPASIDLIAHEVVQATGPSGSNLSYLKELAEVIRLLQGEDRHVFSLEETVQKLLQSGDLTGPKGWEDIL